ncbi:hypothetical protein [Georgenia muralis]|uniref:Uncharacterized protein n=1 Tax=Georgenia muralis TaxID=154117 RepID=A0A3N4Z5Z1_9MICO|nr:hypothetical protein [Georgenia muralis]RPF26560.1 hypothetical protein EDD32_1007 [Georgenia muralis]
MDWTALHRLHEVELVAAGVMRGRAGRDVGWADVSWPDGGAPVRRRSRWAAASAALGRTVRAARGRRVTWDAACATCA